MLLSFHSAFPILTSLFVLAFLSGCQNNEVEIGQVTGVVTLDGRPIENAVVYFYPDAGGRSSIGITNAEGAYELTYRGDVKGAKIGTHSVSLTTSTEDVIGENGKIKKGAPERFPPEYSREGTVKREVNAGDNQINFDVLSK